MTPQELTQSIRLANNGYLFAPTAEELTVARTYPGLFRVVYVGGPFPYRILFS